MLKRLRHHRRSRHSRSRSSAGDNEATSRSGFIAELEQLARLTAFRQDLRVEAKSSGSNWSFNWRTGTITVDGAKLLAESADFSRGLIMHESAHAAITRLHAIVPWEILSDRRLFCLLNVIEDCRIETWMQIRFPGCRPWVCEYNDRLFHPSLAGGEELHPSSQFLNGILARWWFGHQTTPLCKEVAEALDSIWPALERILKALPPPPDKLGNATTAYLASPVSNCYVILDRSEPPTPCEQAIRTAQYRMWAILHEEILPIYTKFLPPRQTMDKTLQDWFELLANALQSHNGDGMGLPLDPIVPVQSSCAGGNQDPSDPLPDGGVDPYNQSAERQRSSIEILGDALLRLFQAHGRMRLRKGYPWGTRVDLRTAMSFEADPRLHDKLWSRLHTPRRIDPEFNLVIDRSGSMRGEKIEQSFHGTVLLCEVCRRVGIPLNIHVFGSDTERILSHDEPLSDIVRGRIGALPNAADGGTDLGAALQSVAGDVLNSPYQDRFVLVLSDGKPDDEQSTRRQMAHLIQDGVTLIGLGLGSGTEPLKDLFPTSRTNLTPQEVPGALGSMLFQCLRA